MNHINRPNYSSEFKLEAAHLVLKQGYTIVEAAAAMNVAKSTLGKWVRRIKNEQLGTVQSGQPLTADQRKIRALEQRLKRIELEKEILKKATALLMSDSMNNVR